MSSKPSSKSASARSKSASAPSKPRPQFFDEFFAPRKPVSLPVSSSPTKPLAAATALLSPDRTSVLMLERDGIYSLPGGKAELGESHEQAARREFEEETGLRLGPITQLARFESSRFDIVRYVAVEAVGDLRASDEGKPVWRPIRLLGTKARFPRADADLARLLVDGGWVR